MDYFERKLDSKNRLTIPAETQDEFPGGQVIITRGFGQYLHLYARKTWDSEMEPALSGDILDEDTADINVKFRSGKVTVEMDQKQGRITLPQHLLDYAGIKRKIVAVRAGQYWRLMSEEVAQESIR